MIGYFVVGVILGITLAFANYYKRQNDWLEKELEKTKAEGDQLKTELEVLNYQPEGEDNGYGI